MTWEGLTPPYRTIVADPPWEPSDERGFASGSANGRPWKRNPLPYSSMTLEEIAALPVAELADPQGAFLFLWTTNRYLPDAFDVVDMWGFTYRQTLIWHKGDASPFPAAVTPNSAEFLLVSRSGAVRRTGTGPASVVSANRGSHSSKPAAFLDLIERVSPGPRVELFARSPRLGWDSWGYGYEQAS